eukprot:CAMPEP_0185028428 /NCGR_PEP_ID=MMETSP1103-20130426/14134_1 /TAXON_ID=36769 /ORGANISM="Paraphysomonas bandaiensis, Strain Caron Lab Isolate" /LENGTH=198 /DNA_ID=CAMNT_0027562847 /DNA_START=90 /DNA_END=686 /DNA_ORIENTATION=-
MDWNETKSILMEIEQLFSRDDDIRDIEDIHKMNQEIEVQRSHQLQDFKDLIKKYTATVVAKEHEILAPAANVHSKKIEKLQVEKENLLQTESQVSNAVNSKTEEISKLASKAVELQEKTKECTLDEHMTESRTSYALSLYSKVSNISWDYDAAPGHLAGCFGNDETMEFVNFDFDMSTMSSYDLANSLWDMIGSEASC